VDELNTDPDLFDATAELGAALRSALSAAVSTAVPAALLREAAAGIRRATDHLVSRQRPAWELSPLDDMDAGVRVFNPVLGPGNGLAVPLRFEQDGDTVVARTSLGRVYEGPPTFVHGGVTALLMDQVLGHGAIVAGRWGMTVQLDLRYRRPVPLHTPLRLTSRVSEAAGRRTTVTGTVTTEEDPDVPLVEATGVFVTPSLSTSSNYFGRVRTAAGGPTNGHLGRQTPERGIAEAAG
jgi:acyl-coenzyme A thioesterase PaaI-like protein